MTELSLGVYPWLIHKFKREDDVQLERAMFYCLVYLCIALFMCIAFFNPLQSHIHLISSSKADLNLVSMGTKTYQEACWTASVSPSHKVQTIKQTKMISVAWKNACVTIIHSKLCIIVTQALLQATLIIFVCLIVISVAWNYIRG